MSSTIDPGATSHLLPAFRALLGRSGKIIESEIRGTSMGSGLPSGCRIRIRPIIPVTDYHVGQIVAFVSANTLFAHRIVYRTRQGVLTRGDARSLCDLPVPFDAVLGIVTECLLDGEWRPLQDRIRFDWERRRRSQAAEMLLRVCMQIDIRLARRTAKMIMRIARWSHLVVASVRRRRHVQ